jgi:hypothetical protein
MEPQADGGQPAPGPGAPESTWVLESAEADHYLALEDARVVGTKSVRVCRDNIADVMEAKAMACMYGGAGYGKSLSVNAALRELAPGATTIRVVFRSRPTPRDIRHALFHGLHLPGDPPAHPIEFDTLLKAALSDRFRVLVCDEAQWMGRECFEYWRHLWDDRTTTISVIFVGGGDCYKVLRREPMLASRIYLWQEFRKMELEEVIEVIPAFHPVWEKADANLIAFTDLHAGHGNFRAWARITRHALQGLRRRGPGSAVDRDLVQWVFSRLGEETM